MELSYGKKELEQLAKLYGIKGAYKLKKAELIEALLQAIPEKMPEILPMLDTKDLEKLNQLCETPKLVAEDEELDDYYNLMELELVQFIKNKEESKLVVPPIIKSSYQNVNMDEIMPLIVRNSTVRDYIIAILNLYGIVELEWAAKLFNKYYTPEISEIELANFVKQDMRIACQSKIMEKYIVEETIYALDKNNFKDFAKSTIDKDYFIPSKELLEKLKDETYYEPSLHIEKLKAYLKRNYKVTDEVIEQAIIAVTMMSKVDCDKTGRTMELILGELVNLGIEFGTLANINEVIKHITPVVDVTRKWINKGYTNQELSPYKFNEKTGQKINTINVGRNDPCPCGSGKKYKKCCGK